MDPQERFWRALYELVSHTYFLEGYCQLSAVWERRINIILALTSTSSLGIWAVFKQFPFIWSGIIVATQVIGATGKLLPFSSRVRAASACAHEYRANMNWAEARWCEIADGLLTDAEISKARVDLQAKTAKSLKSHFPLGGLPDNPGLLHQAEIRANQYLTHHYA